MISKKQAETSPWIFFTDSQKLWKPHSFKKCYSDFLGPSKLIILWHYPFKPNITKKKKMSPEWLAVELSDEDVEDLLEVLLLGHNVPKNQLFSEMDHEFLFLCGFFFHDNYNS